MNRKGIVFFVICVSMLSACMKTQNENRIRNDEETTDMSMYEMTSVENTSEIYTETSEESETIKYLTDIGLGAMQTGREYPEITVGEVLMPEEIPFGKEDIYGLFTEMKKLDGEWSLGGTLAKPKEEIVINGCPYYKLEKTWQEYKEWALELYEEEYVNEVFIPKWERVSCHYFDEEGNIYRAPADAPNAMSYDVDTIEISKAPGIDAYFIKVWQTVSCDEKMDCMVYYVKYHEDSRHKIRIVGSFCIDSAAWHEEKTN